MRSSTQSTKTSVLDTLLPGSLFFIASSEFFVFFSLPFSLDDTTRRQDSFFLAPSRLINLPSKQSDLSSRYLSFLIMTSELIIMDPWQQEDEQLMNMCLDNDDKASSSFFWNRWFGGGGAKQDSAEEAEETHSEEVEDETPSTRTSLPLNEQASKASADDASSVTSDASDDSILMMDQHPWVQEDELLLQQCIAYDPWKALFTGTKDKTRKLLLRSGSSHHGTLRRVSSVGGLSRVSSRAQL